MGFVSLSKSIDFLYKYSLFQKGYTIYNSLIFSIIGLVIYFFVMLAYIRWRKIKIDFNLVKSVLIFIGIGVILRIFSQEGLSLKNIITFSLDKSSLGFYFHFPQLFILIGLIFLLFFEISVFFSKSTKFSYNQILQAIGLVIFIPLLLYVFLYIENWTFFFLVIILSLTILYLLILIFRLFKSKLFKSNINKLVVLSQILDGVSTFTALTFLKDKVFEQHILSNFILSINPIVFVIVKVLFSLLLIWVIDKLIEKQELNIYFKLFIIIIGFTTGLKDLLIISLIP